MTTRRNVLAGAMALATTRQAWAQKKGGILKVSAPTNPSSLDPTTGGSGQDHAFLYPIFDTLVAFEWSTLKAVPGLAESWKWADPKTLVLNIRSGVLFHDGTPLDAEAVKFNLERSRSDQRSSIKADLGSVQAVEVSGPQQVTLKLSQPDTALPLILSDRAGMMSSPKAVKELGKDHDRKPVGTGPWKFVSWNDNEKVVYTRNDKYWQAGQPLLDGIEMNVIAETNTGLRSVVAGQNDFVYFLAPQQKQIIDRAKSLTAVTGPTLYCIQLFLNYGRPPLDNPKVRLAINHAIDRQAYSKATMGGIAEVAWMALPTAHWAYDPKLANVWPHDPDKAKKLLAEAGPSQRHRSHVSRLLRPAQPAAPGGADRAALQGRHPAEVADRLDPRDERGLLCRQEGRGLAGGVDRAARSVADLLADVLGKLLLQRRPQGMVARADGGAAGDPRERGHRGAQGRFRQGPEDRRAKPLCSCRWCSSSSSMPWSARSRATSPICWASRASTACGWSHRRAFHVEVPSSRFSRQCRRPRPRAGPALAQKKGGVLKVSANANPSSLDPTTGGSGSDHAFLYPIFDTLIDFEPATLKALPGLAEVVEQSRSEDPGAEHPRRRHLP